MGPATDRYFARAKVGGKLIRRQLIRQSLKTSTDSVAVLRLNDLLKENRGRMEIREAWKSGPITFQQAAERLLIRGDAGPSLKPATWVYHRRSAPQLAGPTRHRRPPNHAPPVPGLGRGFRQALLGDDGQQHRRNPSHGV